MNSFKLKTSYINAISTLSLEEKGLLLEEIFAYTADMPLYREKELPAAVQVAFGFIKDGIDEEKHKDSLRCAKNRESAKKRWAATSAEKTIRAELQEKYANVCECTKNMQTHTNAQEKCERIQTHNTECERIPQKEEKKAAPLTIPQQENNKNIYNSPHSKECTPLLPKDDSGMYDIEELIAKSEPKPKPKKKAFVPPTLPEVQEYVKERGLMIDPAAFFDYFTEGEWKDSEGKPVKNWKQKALTWDCSARTRRTLDAARHLLPKKSAVKSATYSEEIPL